MSRLILIRGLPGSGKTTIAKSDYPNYIHYEADQFFVDQNGVYKFDPSLIKEAHGNCQKQVREGLNNGYRIVVSNNFTQWWELHPYLRMGYFTKIIIATGTYKNIHNVPQDIIDKMKTRWED